MESGASEVYTIELYLYAYTPSTVAVQAVSPFPSVCDHEHLPLSSSPHTASKASGRTLS